jgi:hypothetical protein
MSEGENKDKKKDGEQKGGETPEPEPKQFDFYEWLDNVHLTEPGKRKLAASAVVDEESLLLLRDKDVVNLKLAAGDRVKFEKALFLLRSSRKAVIDTSEVIVEQNGHVQLPVTENPSPQATAQVGQVGVPVQSQASFTLEEVATFIAGGVVPPNVQFAVNNVHTGLLRTQPLSGGQPSLPSSLQPPFCFPPPSYGQPSLTPSYGQLPLTTSYGQQSLASGLAQNTVPLYRAQNNLQTAVSGLQLQGQGYG